jgi:hypothetical protein
VALRLEGDEGVLRDERFPEAQTVVVYEIYICTYQIKALGFLHLSRPLVHSKPQRVRDIVMCGGVSWDEV